MAGDEGYLGWNLCKAIGVPDRNYPTEDTRFRSLTDHWRRGDGMAQIEKGGSVNIPMLRWATRLWNGDHKAPKVLLDFLTKSRNQWMYSEVGSRIYGMWHFLAVVSVYRWAIEQRQELLMDLSEEWLNTWFYFVNQSTAPDGRVLMVGMRSAGHKPNPGLLEWSTELYKSFSGEGGNPGHWEAQIRRARLGLKQKWEYAACRHLFPIIAETRLTRARIPAFRPVAKYTFLRSKYGLMAVYVDRNLNGNTPPVAAAVWDNGKISWAPADGGARIRQKFDTMTCKWEGQKLVYSSSLYGKAELRLPEKVVSVGLF